jgi:formylglycine-generating enzyme required for sulfatase activity
MGCSPGDRECGDDEKPAHRVRITRSFELGKYEITQAQWDVVMGANPSEFKGPDRPVEQVSWNDIQDFLRRLNGRNDGYRYRLPTEAEWEYAARAGTTGPYYGDLDAIAWYGRNSGNQTHSVGGKQPNPWGLYDMIGNVWEWCQDWYTNDWYQKSAKSPAVDPRGPANGEYRVMRGGSWYQYLWFLRVSSPFRERPGGRYRHTGFRCLREKADRLQPSNRHR